MQASHAPRRKGDGDTLAHTNFGGATGAQEVCKEKQFNTAETS